MTKRNFIFRLAGKAVAIIAVMFLTGCEAVSYYTSERLNRDEAKPRILLMPMDITLSELSAGGYPEPNAAWTEQATGHARRAIREHLADKNTDFMAYGDADALAPDSDISQLVKLHSVVGQTILDNHFVPPRRLPSKNNAFDWTLGEAAQGLSADTGTDYALFIRLEDSYSSAGRVVVSVLAAALFGVSVPGGQQMGFASLVDLRTGEVVWFNRLARGTGDLREYEPAVETISVLLQDLPS